MIYFTLWCLFCNLLAGFVLWALLPSATGFLALMYFFFGMTLLITSNWNFIKHLTGRF